MAGDVKFCFKCPNTKLTKGKKYYMCGAKNCDVKIPTENALDILEKHVGGMIYCYHCGEELVKAEAGIMCADGCGLKIEEQAADENVKPDLHDEMQKNLVPEPHKAVKYQPEPEPDSEQDELGTEHDHFKSYKPGSEEGKVDLDHHEHRNEVDKAEQQDMSGPEQNMPGQKKPDPDEPGTEHDHLKPYKPQCEQDKVDFVHNEHTNMPEKKGPEQYILEAEQNMPGPKQTDPEQHEPGTEHDHLKPYEPGSEQDKVNLDHNERRNGPENKGPEQYILEPEQNMPGQNKPDPEKGEPDTEHDHLKPYKPGSEEDKLDLDYNEHRTVLEKQDPKQHEPEPERNMPGHELDWPGTEHDHLKSGFGHRNEPEKEGPKQHKPQLEQKFSGQNIPSPKHDEAGIEHDHLKPYEPWSGRVNLDHHDDRNEVDKPDQQNVSDPKQYKPEPEQNMPGPKQPDPEQHEPGTEHDHFKPYEPGSEQDKVNLDHNKCRNAPEKKGPEQYILEPEQNMPGQNKPDPEKGEPDTGHDHLKPYKPASEEDKVDLDHNEHRNEVDKAELQDMSGSEQNKQKPEQNMPGPKQPDLMQHEPGTEHDHLKPYKPGSEEDKVDLDHNEHRNEVDKAEQQDMSGSEQNKQKPNMPGPKQPDLMQHKPGTEHDHLKPYKPGSEEDKVDLDHNEHRNEVDKAEQQDMSGSEQNKQKPNMPGPKQPDLMQHKPGTEHDHLKPYEPGSEQDKVNLDHNEWRNAPKKKGPEQYILEPEQNMPGQNKPDPEKGEPDTEHDHLKPYKPVPEQDKVYLDYNEHRNVPEKHIPEQHELEPDPNMSGQNMPDTKQDEPVTEHDHLKPFKPGSEQGKVDLDHHEHKNEVDNAQHQDMSGPKQYKPKSEESTSSQDESCHEHGMPDPKQEAEHGEERLTVGTLEVPEYLTADGKNTSGDDEGEEEEFEDAQDRQPWMPEIVYQGQAMSPVKENPKDYKHRKRVSETRKHADFRTPTFQCVNVVFHVLLPQEVWGWTKKSGMHIRFGHPRLGGWKYDCGNMLPVNQDPNDPLLLMRGAFPIPAEVAKLAKNFQYKYVVYAEKSKKNVIDVYEHLAGYASLGNANRVLEIPSTSAKSGETYSHYDAICLPQKSLWEKLKDIGLDFVGRGCNDIGTTSATALSTYLNSQLLDSSMGPAAIKDSSSIFEPIKQLHSQKVYSTYYNQMYSAEVTGIVEVVMKWIKDTATTILNVRADQGLKPFATGWIMLELFHKLMVHFGPKFLAHHERCCYLLVKLMKPSPDMDNETCKEFQFIQTGISANRFVTVADTLSTVCSVLIESPTLYYEWLLAVPLLHLLKGYMKPFMPVRNRHKISNEVITAGLDLTKFHPKPGIPGQVLKLVEPLFHLDNLLLKTWVLTLPSEDYPWLVKNVPEAIPFATSLTASLWKKYRKTLKDPEVFSICTGLKQLISAVDECGISMDLEFFTFGDYWYLISGALDMFAHLCKYTEGKNVAVISLVATLLLKGLNQAYPTNEFKGFVDTYLPVVQTDLRGWLQSKNVIGSNKFGGKGSASDEIMIWNNLLALECPKSLESQWQTHLVTLMTTRVERLDPKTQLRLISSRDMDYINPKIMDVLTSSVLKEINKGTLKDPALQSKYLFLDYKKMPRAGEILGAILEQQYPTYNLVTLQSLLDWGVWPQYFKLYVSSEEVAVQLPQLSHRLIEEALRVFSDFCNDIISGEVLLHQIKSTQGKTECIEECYKSGHEQILHKFPDYLELMSALKLRWLEYDAYTERTIKLDHLARLCTKVAPGAAKKLLQDLQEDNSNVSLCRLCKAHVFKGDDVTKLEFFCFDLGEDAEEMLDQFHVMMKKVKPNLICKLWDTAVEDQYRTLTSGKNSPDVTFREVYIRIWRPSYQECENTIEQLSTLQLPLHKVKEYFFSYSVQRKLEEELNKLCNAINICQKSSSQAFIKTPWIRDASSTIFTYKQLCQYGGAAETFLKLRDTLGLTGDFAVVETLSKAISTELDDEALLESIDESSSETSDVLKDIADNPKHKLCLDAFCRSYELVKWIRVETRNVGQLQNFVQVALATSGEGDMIRDLLSQLHTVGSAYASLIYDLPKDASCQALVGRCKGLWGDLDKHPNLSQIIDSCNKCLGEFQRIKEALGDVERNAFKLMEAINASGVYKIASREGKILHCIEDAIELRVQGGVKNLDKLRDLHSKLVLISGTATKPVGKKFLEVLHLVQVIAEKLVLLQQAGNIKYIGFEMKFSCACVEATDLEDYIDMMERDLNTWLHQVERSRKKYYHLNYFTAEQLVLLRKELGSVRTNPKLSVNPQLHCLLQSVCLLPTLEIIRHALEITEGEQSLSLKTKTDQSCKESIISTTLKYESLSEKQKEIYKELKEQDFQDKLILDALAEVEEDEEEARDWCFVHEAEYKDMETNIPKPQSTKMIDKNHPQVQELMHSYDYPVEIAIEAVQKAGEDFERAMDIAVLLIPGGGSNHDPLVESCLATTRENWGLPSRYVGTPLTVSYTSETDRKYLGLEELGEFMKELSFQAAEQEMKGELPQKRRGKKFALNPGTHNLIIIKRELIWKAVLSLYIGDYTLPLPTSEEVLVCTTTTTAEEVTLLWHRAVNDPGKKRVFCLVHPEKLSYQACDEALRKLDVITQGCQDYRLVIVCAIGEQEKTHITSRLSSYQRKIDPLPSDQDIADYLRSHYKSCFSRIPMSSQPSSSDRDLLKCLQSCVRVVISTRPGMGKSLYVKRIAEKMSSLCGDNTENSQCVCISVNGPEATPDEIVEFLLPHYQVPSASFAQTLHFDIAHSVIPSIDSLLFNILVLGVLSDSHGRVWRRQQSQICVVECTLTHLKEIDKDTNTWYLKMHKDENTTVRSTYAFLSLMPVTHCVSPRKVLEYYTTGELVPHGEVLMDDAICKGKELQQCYQYLRRVECGISLARFHANPSKPEGSPKDCLPILMRYMKTNVTPSWSEFWNFIKFLSFQLQDCEMSYYTDPDIMDDGSLSGFKEFIVKFMIQMSKEFTSPSLKKAWEAEAEEESEDDIIAKYNFIDEQRWNTSNHPYLFFNQGHHTMTFLGFSISPDGDLIDHETKEIIERGLMSKTLFTDLQAYGALSSEEYDEQNKEKMIETLAAVLGIVSANDPDPTYVLTTDNVMKMLAIHVRFRCNIPVILMGETGCGKTRLLRYLCELQAKNYGTKNLLTMKIHGGTTKHMIETEVERAIMLAKRNKKNFGDKVHTVLFFDEANTTDALGLIKEIMCDRRLNGKPIKEDIKFAAACNPYRMHSDEMVHKLRTVGLGFYMSDKEKIPKLGSIPLRKLVYRVHELSPSMDHLVYDFGQLTGGTEDRYIWRIVSYFLLSKLTPDLVKFYQTVDNLETALVEKFADQKLFGASEKETIAEAAFKILAWCQSYMRKQTDECSYVSLRDIVRAMIVFEWFFKKLSPSQEFNALLQQKEKQEMPADTEPLDNEVKALIYAVAVCYHARLSDRRRFEEGIIQQFPHDFCDISAERFRKEIERCEKVFLEAMTVPKNIALNAALRENVFMMVVCIENHLPLFLVGKPGSSKSLAKSIVVNSMQGRSSSNRLLKHLKQVQLFQYQCSQFSTAESIREVFEAAKEFQDYKDDYANFVSVVVLEEVGLAEDSPGLPLKTLHPYLEDGTAGIFSDEEEVSREKRVAFIGISNWALDPAKMNRGIMVERCPPTEDELTQSAEGIASMVESDENDDLDPNTATQISLELKALFPTLSEMYSNLCRKQESEREFFGLRDFYSLIKMLCCMCLEAKQIPSQQNIQHAILRNFSGHETLDPFKELPRSHIILGTPQVKKDTVDIVKASLETISHPSSFRENRYLLFLTENLSALHILQNHLLPRSSETPFILYGSSFPKDQEYTQVCRNVNQIKICMETGRPVVLLNLENIYESLYDVLNQFYTDLPGGRYVDLGLRLHRVKCRVHENFRLIIIAERSKVFEEFPTALINRLEKHFILSESILNDTQAALTEEIRQWVEDFSAIKDDHTVTQSFQESDAFVGYQRDTPASIVLHASEMVKCINPSEDLCSEEEEIRKLSKNLLLQLASQDALARLKASKMGKDSKLIKRAFDVYFHEQKHVSFIEFLKHYLNLENSAKQCILEKEGVLLQVTTYGLLLSHHEAKDLASQLNLSEENIKLFLLQEFDTEMDFCRKIREVFQAPNDGDKLLIVQCDGGHQNADLIACARYRVTDERRHKKTQGQTHVVFLIQLPRVAGGTSFASFHGGHWISTHIDDLHSSQNLSSTIQAALVDPPGEFFTSLLHNSHTMPEFVPTVRIRNIVHSVVADLISDRTRGRAEQLIVLLLQLIPEQFIKGTGTFVEILLEKVCHLLKERDETLPRSSDWAMEAACDGQRLQCSHTLINTLTRRLDEILKLILAHVIVRIDHNNNLSLLNPEKQDGPLERLWLSVFHHSTVFPLRYTDVSTSSIASTMIKKRQFTCEFPFSWELIDHIDTVAPSISEDSSIHTLYDDLCNTLGQSAMQEILHTVDDTFSHEFYERYLHDFVCSLSLDIKDFENSTKLIKSSVDKVARELQPALTENQPFPLISGIAAIHLSYRKIESEVYWFVELTKHFQTLPNELIEHPEEQMVLHLCALKSVLGILSPNKSWSFAELREWVQKVHLCKNSVESLLGCITDTDPDINFQLRNTWMKIQVVVLFTEHVLIKLPESDPTILKTPQRFFGLLGKIPFSDGKILKKVIVQVTGTVRNYKTNEQVRELNCSRCGNSSKLECTKVLPCPAQHIFCQNCFPKTFSIEQKCPECHEHIPLDAKLHVPAFMRKKLQEYQRVQRWCRDFFMDFICEVCFSTSTPVYPDESFVRELLQIVFSMGDVEMYRDFYPFEEDQSQKCPIIRSFILQFLLEYRPHQVKENLQSYMEHCQSKLGPHFFVDDIDLSLLCIKCMEDKLHKEYLQQSSLVERLQFASDSLEKSLEVLGNNARVKELSEKMDIKYMESIAKDDEYQTLSRAEKDHLKNLTLCAKDVCQERCVIIEPRYFLAKQLVRQFGFPCLYKLSQHISFKSWIIPVGRLENQVGIAVLPTRDADDFVIYGESYTLQRARFESLKIDIEALKEELDTSSAEVTVATVLALYNHVLHPSSPNAEMNVMNSNVIDVFSQLRVIIQKNKLLSPMMRNAMSGDFTNDDEEEHDQPVVLSFCATEPSLERLLSDIVVHVTTVLLSRWLDVGLITPLALTITNPLELKEQYLPTMPDDVFDVIVSTLSENEYGGWRDTLWKCPNGHKYFIQDCGRPISADQQCLECGAEIGGVGYNVPAPGNEKLDDSIQETKCGDILGCPEDQKMVPTPERELNPVACALIRILLHSGLVWTASIPKRHICEAVASVPVPPVGITQGLNHFWHHLEKDFQILQLALGKSMDDAALLVHLLLHKMLTTSPPRNDGYSWDGVKERSVWEKNFDLEYIQPILENLDTLLSEAQKLVVDNYNKESDELFQIVYEEDIKHKSDVQMHLWTYRPRITIDHMIHAAQQDKSRPLLLRFLEMETLLRAIQFLPDIARLQRCLYELCNHRVDRDVAESLTMATFIQNEIKKDHHRRDYHKMVESFIVAWQLLKDDLGRFAKAAILRKYLKVEVTEKLPLAFFIPANSGPGICGVALVSRLARLQNDIIEYTRNHAVEQGYGTKHYKIHLSQVQKCHVINFEQHLLHVVLSHCQYSLKTGFGADVVYDLPALEKHIVDRFIHGKPEIDVNIPVISFKTDVVQTTGFAKVRNNIPQDPLPAHVKQDIVKELNKTQSLQDTIDIVTVALGFLSCGTWNPNTLLSRYIKTLKMEKKLSPNVEEHCRLGNILSLWKLLCVEQARQLALGENDPFGNVSDAFKERLSEDQQGKLETSLVPYDLDQLLETLYEFIITHILYCREIERDEELVQSFEDVADHYNIEKIPGFKQKFPKEFSLCHVVEIWKYTAKYQEKLRRRRAF